jgi:hypothetical protein
MAVAVRVPAVPVQVAVAYAPAVPVVAMPPVVMMPVMVMPAVPPMMMVVMAMTDLLNGGVRHRSLRQQRCCGCWREGGTCSEKQSECELADHSMSSFQ